MRSRRTQGVGIPFAPESISGLAGWFKAATINQADSSTVASWADSSVAQTVGALTQTVGASKPIYKTNGINSLPAVSFNNQWLRSAALTLNQPCTVFSIVSFTVQPGVSVSAYIIDGSTSASIGYRMDGSFSSIWTYFSPTVVQGSVAVTGSGPYNLSCVFNNTASKFRQDGGAGGGGTSGTGNFSAITIGADGGNAGASPLNGQIAEMLFYNSALSLNDINSVGRYLANKYALTWNTAT